jgi:hypothetical protein
VPDLSITSVDVVADQTARLNLTAEEGDVAIQTDINETFVLSTNDPSVNSNWKKVQLDVVGAIDGQTITPGQVGTSSNRSNIFADSANINQLAGGEKPRGCRVFLSSNQSISSAQTKIQFDSAVYDSDSDFDISSGSHFYDVPRVGIYAVSFQAVFDSVTAGDRLTVIIGNNNSHTVSDKGAFISREANNSSDRIQATTITRYSGGDKIAFYAGNADSNDLLRGGNDNFNSFAEIAFIGSL